jgi:putative transposase
VPKGRGDGNNRREEKWTKSIAVGSEAFIEQVKSALGALAKGKNSMEAGEVYQIREPSAPYGAHFGVKNEDIGLQNTYYWNVYDE